MTAAALANYWNLPYDQGLNYRLRVNNYRPPPTTNVHKLTTVTTILLREFLATATYAILDV